MHRSLYFVECLTYRSSKPFDPLRFLVSALEEELSKCDGAEEFRRAIKAYGCEFDNYLTCRTKQEIDEQLRQHRRDHLYFWYDGTCGTDSPFSPKVNVDDDGEYDAAAKTFTRLVHKQLMQVRCELPQDCTVYHGLVGLRQTFEAPYRYMSTTTDLYMALNFAENEDLTERIEDKSDYPIVLEVFLPAGTMAFTTDICYCVQKENEVTLAYDGEVMITPDYTQKKLVTKEFEVTGLERDENGERVEKRVGHVRRFYTIPAVHKPGDGLRIVPP